MVTGVGIGRQGFSAKLENWFYVRCKSLPRDTLLNGQTKGKTMSKLTKIVGFVFFGGWCLLGTAFYMIAVIESLFC